jgi:thioredoxin 2
MSDAVKLACATCGQMNRVPLAKLAEGPKCGACGDPLADGKVIELDARAHDKATRSDEMPLLVDYWAPWCGPCRMMAPEFAKAATALRGRARLAKLNTEDHPEIASRARIQGIPALVLYAKGREIARLSGARPASEIVTFVQGRLGA